MRLWGRIKAVCTKKRVQVMLLCLGGVLFIGAAGLCADYLYYRARIYPGVTLYAISLGGLTLDETEEKLEKELWFVEQFEFLMAGGESIEMTMEDLGLSWDKRATLENIYRAGRGWPGYRVRLESLIYKSPIDVEGLLLVDESRLGSSMAELASLSYRIPRNAVFEVDGETVTIVKEEDGRFLKVKALRESIMDALCRAEPKVKVPAGEWPATRTTADLESYGVGQVMFSFYTDVAGGNPDRVHNIRLGAAAINGYLLAPGDIFSFIEVVGRSTLEKGYRPAPIIVGDELVPGIGGGLCQVSSTLYNAALLANLEIVERHNHSMTVAYLPLGRDATVAYNYLDLKIKNNRDHYILIGADLYNLQLKFRIFGPPMAEEVKIVSSGYQQVAPPVRHEYTSELPAGTTELLNPGSPGHYITIWRVVYLDGKEISREMISRDYYRPTPALYLVGTG